MQSGELQSMTVDFQSYGCGTSGHWNTGDCLTTGSPTFTVPGGITASLYTVDGSGNPEYPAVATATNGDPIPFRPSADPTNCPGGVGGGIANGSQFVHDAGQYVYSISKLITFNFPSGDNSADGDTVIWTVQFNTTNSGYTPIGPTTCSATAQGCGYDSLNVGVKTDPDVWAFMA